MNHYWLHIHGGTILTQHGPFASVEEAQTWRKPYYGSDEEPPTEKVPGLGSFDDYGADTWVLISTNGSKLESET